MYTPDKYLMDDAAQQQALMADNPFAQLVTVDRDGMPHATHLPVLYMDGVLDVHMAKANPQWQHFENGWEVLVIFSGPHGYISPSWYESVPAVPTWNYTAVHVYGRPRLIEDPAQKKARQSHLVDIMESGFAEPWRMELPSKYEQGMLAGIVTFEVDITRIEGKAKLVQKRKPEDAQGAIDGLRTTGRAGDAALADLMAQNLAGGS